MTAPQSVPAALQAATAALSAAGIDTGQPIDANTQLTSPVRLALEGLAVSLGATQQEAQHMAPADILSLYGVAKAAPLAGRQLLARIKQRGTMPPIGSPAPAAPAAAPSPSPVDTGALVATAAAEAARIVLDDTRPRLDAMRADVEAIKSSAPMLVSVALATPGNPSPAPSAPMLAHALFPRVVKLVAGGKVSPMLVGPAGSGKSKLAEQVAEALSLPFYEAAKVTSEHQLLGFINATGAIVRTPFREAWEHGGVFFFDEVDASNPSALTAFNGALANTVCPFPDMNVRRHPNFRAIAAANTIGTGATRQYAGRNALDGATRDRFYFMQMDYDTALETALAPVKSWAHLIQTLRSECASMGWQVIISPRASIAGGAALLAGETVMEALNATALKDLDGEQVTRLLEAVYLPAFERDIRKEVEALSNPILSAVA